ncbi:TOMM precursor leader peptide-binding protein [Nonomuraea jiangxiensis]|uniref:Ribosomal protein S12 methylthiotransferase accessory factor n=1 Tax=Nonomuraea jiangxiensis TaxID=633440 RepID=A0A1G8S0K6_9ACTN|nr:TOMM precursor leader peptide-binding protein [Nonomuraea jiangxiensis]SDJ22325.1 ribosomal protein S12 methylthiotransferase accessory factor [Nonomuraea jiangxiensis]
MNRRPEREPLLRAVAHRLSCGQETLDDEPRLAVHEATGLAAETIGARMRAESGPILWVEENDQGLWIGPATRGGRPGCPECVRRRNLAMRTATGASQSRPRPRPALGLALLTVAALAETRLSSLRLGAVPDDLLRLDPDTLEISRHSLLPDPTCPLCGGLPADTPQAAAITLISRPKPGVETFRARAVDGAELRRRYVDDHHGVIGRPRVDELVAFPTSGAPVGVPGRPTAEMGYGRALDHGSAELVAILEALERFGGIRPGGRRTVVTASYAELAGRALDPRTLGLHDSARYDSPGFPFRRFTKSARCDWVHGHSFARDGAVLVPESYAYYGLHRHGADRPFVYEISNGCALGTCLEEAILHGLLEVAERDAFLLAWYSRATPPTIDLDATGDPRIPLMVTRLRQLTGYDVHAFDITAEQGIPSVWALATAPPGRPDLPAALCAAGSALLPAKAVRAALHELSTMVEAHLDSYPGERERAAHMAADPELVTEMKDHALLYCHPAAAERLSFLFGGPIAGPPAAWPAHDDLRDDLAEMIRRYLDSGLDVVVVDQTTPEHRAAGLSCVKVIVPGALPMTFGHARRRVAGLTRISTVPARLGWSSTARSAEPNPDPHPFP